MLQPRITNDTHHHQQLKIEISQLNEYFYEKLKTKNNSFPQAVVKDATQRVQGVINKVNDQIEHGYMFISENCKDFKDLLIQEKINKQEEKAVQLKIKKQELQRQLKYLNIQLHGSSSGTDLFAPNILSKQQHEKLVKKTVKDRIQAAKKRKKYQQELQKSIAQEIEKQKKANQQLQEKQKQQRRKKIVQKLKQHHQQQMKKLEQQETQNNKLQEIKNQKFLYQKIQQKYNSQVVIPSLQEKKKKLKEIRQISKFDINSIKSHQKQYLRKRQASVQNHSRAEVHWGYKPPEKSDRLNRILEQQKIETKKRLQEKKRQIQDKIKRQQDFVAELKQKYIPTIDTKKREEIELRLKKQPRKQSIDAKIAGISYLQQAKRLAKKSQTTQRPATKNYQYSQSSDSRTAKQKKSATNYLISGKNREEYQQIRRKRLEKLVNSQDITAPEKIKKLHIQANRVAQQAKRKQQLSKHTKNEIVQQQAIDLLLTSIKAKIGIIDIYKQQ